MVDEDKVQYDRIKTFDLRVVRYNNAPDKFRLEQRVRVLMVTKMSGAVLGVSHVWEPVEEVWI